MWELIKYGLTFFITVLIPVYVRKYGPYNFLWLSDIGLFLTLIALWVHSPLLMSMAACGVMAMESFWCFAFFARLLFNIRVTNLAEYMFDPSYPRYLRALSLFHIITPAIWITYFFDHIYDTRAFFFFTVLYWIILLVTYAVQKPFDNINWVFSFGRDTLRSYIWVIFLAIFYPLLVVLPTHYVYMYFFA